ncbi:tol-pal system protein YbgF [uncultured Bartonella sp.]|uniref:tol-pal system protein YbgF n=1 Tax=uncultured Bartonella sp. TaxID=104108 RepID=UPI00262F345D|nr:tol-pal system protein YbgF [uncultured Bartonella sp.]
MGLKARLCLSAYSVKRLSCTAAFVWVMSVLALSPSYGAPADQGGSVFSQGFFSLGKKKTAQTENVQLSAPSDNRVSELQQQVRELTGKVEELNFMVLQMQEQLRQLQGNGGSPSLQNPAPQAQSSEAQIRSLNNETNVKQDISRAGDSASLPSVATDKTGEQKNINQEEAPKDLGSIQFDKNGNVLNGSLNQDAVQATPQGASGNVVVPQTASAKELYDIGYRNILAGDYRTAEADFRAFQERYPTDSQIADASFWLGESLFGQKRYREAAQAYIDVQKNYKDSPRGPENLLKLGMSMAHLDEQKVACATFAEVAKRYKTVDPAVLKRVKDEQSRNKCQQ